MERNYDEVIADMLIQLASMEVRLQTENDRLAKENRRIDLLTKRMVRAESTLELFDRKMDARFAAFDQKLEQSIQAQKEFFSMQSELN